MVVGLHVDVIVPQPTTAVACTCEVPIVNRSAEVLLSLRSIVGLKGDTVVVTNPIISAPRGL